MLDLTGVERHNYGEVVCFFSCSVKFQSNFGQSVTFYNYIFLYRYISRLFNNRFWLGCGFLYRFRRRCRLLYNNGCGFFFGRRSGGVPQLVSTKEKRAIIAKIFKMFFIFCSLNIIDNYLTLYDIIL